MSQEKWEAAEHVYRDAVVVFVAVVLILTILIGATWAAVALLES